MGDSSYISSAEEFSEEDMSDSPGTRDKRWLITHAAADKAIPVETQGICGSGVHNFDQITIHQVPDNPSDQNQNSDAANDQFTYSTDMEQVGEEDAAGVETLARVHMFAFKAGHCNLIYDSMYAYIIDSGFNTGQNHCQESYYGNYLRLLYSYKLVAFPKICKSLILTHGHFDHFNSVYTLLFKSDYHFNTIESVIFGANPITYCTPVGHEVQAHSRARNKKRIYFEKLMGSILFYYRGCKLYLSAFKKDVVTLLHLQPRLDVIYNTDAFSVEEKITKLGLAFTTAFLTLTLYDNRSDLSYLKPEFISFSEYNYRDSNYVSVSTAEVVTDIEYEQYLRAGHIKMYFPVLNYEYWCNEDDPLVPSTEDDNYICLMTMVEVMHTPETALKVQNPRVGSLDDLTDQQRQNLDLFCQKPVSTFFFPSNAPAKQLASWNVETVITFYTAHHHSNSQDRDVAIPWMKTTKKPKALVLPMAERFFTPRRGFIEAHSREIPTLQAIAPHNLYYHIYDTSVYRPVPGSGYERRVQGKLAKLYCRQENFNKTIFCLFDRLIVRVMSNRENKIYQSPNCLYPDYVTIRNLAVANTLLND